MFRAPLKQRLRDLSVFWPFSRYFLSLLASMAIHIFYQQKPTDSLWTLLFSRGIECSILNPYLLWTGNLVASRYFSNKSNAAEIVFGEPSTDPIFQDLIPSIYPWKGVLHCSGMLCQSSYPNRDGTQSCLLDLHTCSFKGCTVRGWYQGHFLPKAFLSHFVGHDDDCITATPPSSAPSTTSIGSVQVRSLPTGLRASSLISPRAPSSRGKAVGALSRPFYRTRVLLAIYSQIRSAADKTRVIQCIGWGRRWNRQIAEDVQETLQDLVFLVVSDVQPPDQIPAQVCALSVWWEQAGFIGELLGAAPQGPTIAACLLERCSNCCVGAMVSSADLVGVSHFPEIEWKHLRHSSSSSSSSSTTTTIGVDSNGFVRGSNNVNKTRSFEYRLCRCNRTSLSCLFSKMT